MSDMEKRQAIVSRQVTIMKSQKNALGLAVAAIALLMVSGSVFAQEVTWVSGAGSDTNGCTRESPCRTLAVAVNALSGTVPTGEVKVLDPGDYGPVTITKPITINGDGTLAGITNIGNTAITINAGPSDVVILRNLTMNGSSGSGPTPNPGWNGIKIISAGVVHVENCNLFRNTAAAPQGNGIVVQNTSNTTRLFVNNTSILQNGQSSASAAILLKPTGNGQVVAEIDSSRLNRNFAGLVVDTSGTTGNGIVSIHDSEITGNLYDGILAHSGASGNLRIAVSNNFISDNGYASDAVSQGGVRADGARALIRIYDNHITDNRWGVNITNGGKIYSAGDNMISYNTTNGVFTGTQATQ